MANKIQKGCDGALTIDTKEVGLVDSFSLSLNFNTEEITAIGEDWASYIQCLKDWSGSFSATFDTDEHADAVDAILLGTGKDYTGTFKCGANYTITGNIKITSASINVQKGSKTSLSINFQGNGKPTKTVTGSGT